jgi:low affinity Fe/Cu permease
VFVIQASQNRDAKALHLKLDELLRAVGAARTALAGAEDMAEAEVERAINEIKGESE